MNNTIKLILTGVLLLLFALYNNITKDTWSETLAFLGILLLVIGLVIVWTRKNDTVSHSNGNRNDSYSLQQRQSIRNIVSAHQKATNILINKQGGYLRTTNEVIDILYFMENGKVLRAYMEKDLKVVSFVSMDIQLKKQYDVAINNELRSNLRRGTGNWAYDAKNG